MNNRVKIAIEMQEKLEKKWGKLQEDFYIGYSVNELAYKIAYELLQEFYGNVEYVEIYRKKHKDIYKIAIHFEDDVFFVVDIWWRTGYLGDCGLHCGNATIIGKLPKGYEEIEVE